MSGHLQPRLYPDTPLVSLALQYFRRPNAVPTYLQLLHVGGCCVRVRNANDAYFVA